MALDAAILIADGPAVETHRDRLAILAPPCRLRFDGARDVVHLRDVTGARRGLFEHVPIQMARQQLCLRLIGQHFDQRGVHGQEGAFRCRAENAERGLLDQRAAGRVGAPQRLLGPAPLGDIGGHADDPGNGAVPFTHRRVLRLELEAEQLDPRRHRLAGERSADVGDCLRHVAEQLEERFAHEHTRPHTE